MSTRPAPSRNPWSTPRTNEHPDPGPEPVRHVHGPVAALLDPPVTRYRTETTNTEEDPR